MYYISRKGHEKLSQEIKAIDNEIIDVRRLIGESAARDNDLRENKEFMDLRVKAMYELPNKKRTLWDIYQQSQIIEDTPEYKNFDGKQVIIGSVVDIDFAGEECTYAILGSSEGDIDNNIISCDAPLSKALIGKKIGQEVIFNNQPIRVLAIRKYEN